MGILGRLRLTALRRKSVVLCLLTGLVLVVLCLQYNSAVRGDGSERPQREPDPIIGIGDIFQRGRGGSVQFLRAGEEPEPQPAVAQVQEEVKSPFLSQTLLRLPEQPSRDDVARRRMAAEQLTAGRVLAQVSTPSPPRFAPMDNRVDSNFGIGLPHVRLENYIPPKRIVHFDLKGAPPKIAYLKKIITFVKRLGATGVLLEWEDMFPFTESLAPIKAGNAYTKQELQDLIKFIEDIDLEVIPLVQTFGHVEFALKTEAFASLREVPESPQALCPSNNMSLPFVETIIRQVMELTPNVKNLHIGCDEVFQMGECPKCRLVVRENLFLSHVAKVASFVRRTYPGVTPIIWDDMLRHVPSSSIEDYKLGELVEPMVWVYAEDVYRFVPSAVWDKYTQVFPRVWAASAFKGAFGETMYVPNARRHLENNLRWLEVMTAESPRFKKGFAGIALTGWQRYDHFAVLCELLPAAIPSLAVSLLATTHGYFNSSLKGKLHDSLNCPTDSSQSTFLNLEGDPFLWNKLSRCFFPGSNFYKLLYRLHSTERDVADFLKTVTQSKGWMTEYNVRRNYSSPLRVDELMLEQPQMLHSLASLARHAREALEDIFDPYTIAEWVEQRIYPDLKRLEQFAKDGESLKAVRFWAPRPLPPLQDLYKLGLQQPQDTGRPKR